MESIGEKLKTRREELGLSVEQIARETNISKRYITALEEEDFSSFPGEPYLVGFLRTYSESLGLVSDEIIALYKNFKIQEQPLPMTELLEDKRRNPLPLILIVIAVAALGTGGYFLVPRLIGSIKMRNIARQEGVLEKQLSGVSYDMTDEMLERRFFEGDEIVVSLDGTARSIVLFSVGDNLSVSYGDTSMNIALGEEKLIDLDGDQKEDLKILVRDIDRNAEKRSVIVRFDRFTQERIVSDRALLSDEAFEQGAGTVKPVSIPALGAAGSESRSQSTIVILESDRILPITIDIIFRGYCLLRYLSDGETREERYFHKGETFRLEANREVMLWISNAGSFTAKIAGNDIGMGRPGEVSTKLIKWLEDEESGTFKLQLIPVY